MDTVLSEYAKHALPSFTVEDKRAWYVQARQAAANALMLMRSQDTDCKLLCMAQRYLSPLEDRMLLVAPLYGHVTGMAWDIGGVNKLMERAAAKGRFGWCEAVAVALVTMASRDGDARQRV